MNAAAEDTTTTINRFSAFVKENTQKKVGEADTILDNIRRCKATNPQVYEAKKVAAFLSARAKTLEELVARFITARMTAKYPLIAPELFDMKRTLTIKSGTLTADKTSDFKAEKGHNKVTIPLFAEVPMEGPYSTTLYNHTKQSSRVINTYGDRTYTNTTITLKATLPNPSHEIKIAGRKALGYFHGILGEIYQDQHMCDLLPAEPKAPSLNIIWIPSPDAIGLKVEKTKKTVLAPRPIPIPRSYDPAVTLTVGKMNFLVKLYDIEDEEPLTNLLREFTTGGVVDQPE